MQIWSCKIIHHVQLTSKLFYYFIFSASTLGTHVQTIWLGILDCSCTHLCRLSSCYLPLYWTTCDSQYSFLQGYACTSSALSLEAPYSPVRLTLMIRLTNPTHPSGVGTDVNWACFFALNYVSWRSSVLVLHSHSENIWKWTTEAFSFGINFFYYVMFNSSFLLQ